jgi:hypothetical protein
MRKRKHSKIVTLGVLALLAVGCQRLMNQDAAIQKAIRDHLGERSDLSMDKMVMEVHQVKVDGDKAQAEVVFRTTSDPPAQMNYHYELHREGGAWKVDTGRPSAAEAQHPQMGEAPMDESKSGEGQPSAGALPEGHPPIEQVNPKGTETPTSPHQ